MSRWTCLLALFLSLSAAGFAQEQQQTPCRFRLAVVKRRDTDVWKLVPDERDRWDVLPTEAIEWWLKDGGRKFPEFCMARREDADFVLAWESLSATTRRYRRSRNPVFLETRLERVPVTIYHMATASRKLMPVASISKTKIVGLKPGKPAFESALKTLRKEIQKAATTNPRQ